MAWWPTLAGWSETCRRQISSCALLSPLTLVLLPRSQSLQVVPLFHLLAVRQDISLPLAPLSNLHLQELPPITLLPSTCLPALPSAVKTNLKMTSCCLPLSLPRRASSIRMMSLTISGKGCCTRACRTRMTQTLTRSPTKLSSVALLSSGLSPGPLLPPPFLARAPHPATRARATAVSAAAALLELLIF